MKTQIKDITFGEIVFNYQKTLINDKTKTFQPIDYEGYLKNYPKDKIVRVGQEYDNVQYGAGKWLYCRCSQLSNKIPRDFNPKNSWDYGAPLDEKLKEFGLSFYKAISDGDRNLALEFLDKIKVRGDEILKELDNQ